MSPLFIWSVSRVLVDLFSECLKSIGTVVTVFFFSKCLVCCPFLNGVWAGIYSVLAICWVINACGTLAGVFSHGKLLMVWARPLYYCTGSWVIPTFWRWFAVLGPVGIGIFRFVGFAVMVGGLTCP